jgi:hypothetical protein
VPTAIVAEPESRTDVHRFTVTSSIASSVDSGRCPHARNEKVAEDAVATNSTPILRVAFFTAK